MKKIILPLLTAVLFFSLAGFKLKDKPTLLTGTYGICGCETADANHLKIQLTLNDDHTFHYFDNSDPDKKIDLKGNWSLNNNTVSLKDYQAGFTIHDKWFIDKNGKCIKSRVGLNFERLCNVSECK